MKSSIKIPAVGESITEATIAQWNKKSGDFVKRDEILLTLETDKASVEVVAETDGVLSISVKEGQTVAIGSVVGEIDSGASPTAAAPKTQVTPSVFPSVSSPPPLSASVSTFQAHEAPPPMTNTIVDKPLSPAVRKLVIENQIDPNQVSGSGKDGRVTKSDLLDFMSQLSPKPSTPPSAFSSPAKTVLGSQSVTREPMTKIRQTIARRLVEAQQTAAILTTFNEIDMSRVMELRSLYKDAFEKKHKIKLGFMGFFVKAAIEALKTYPKVNAFIDGTDIVYNHFYNIGIAVGTDKGLLVPVLKNVENMSLAQVEIAIKQYADKARDGKIALDDLNGGTFTISNGGVYGSLMSTPILNPPQSGILGLHKIEERAVVIKGQVEVRPMMYVALSYDHRIIDGAQSVGFLVKIKECMEDPSRILLEV